MLLLSAERQSLCSAFCTLSSLQLKGRWLQNVKVFMSVLLGLWGQAGHAGEAGILWKCLYRCEQPHKKISLLTEL